MAIKIAEIIDCEIRYTFSSTKYLPAPKQTTFCLYDTDSVPKDFTAIIIIAVHFTVGFSALYILWFDLRSIDGDYVLQIIHELF